MERNSLSYLVIVYDDTLLNLNLLLSLPDMDMGSHNQCTLNLLTSLSGKKMNVLIKSNLNILMLSTLEENQIHSTCMNLILNIQLVI